MHIVSHFVSHYIFKSIGVAVLVVLGRVAFFFNPARTVYTFKHIWNKEYDSTDNYWQFAEEFSQS
ncbi:hypothetical protein [Mucilaginibacter terrae]|uniref:Uncharacterized protein n=1 Tax=Mucilaginibacter terrae TaxID=1955052 RepID=A0ABU3GV59_9SPHI|nr:hypothetical protein [Mucilaginibacter terrae]MDT3402832.1 hypothetical protein [Mucilaginibacter terrae]